MGERHLNHRNPNQRQTAPVNPAQHFNRVLTAEQEQVPNPEGQNNLQHLH